MIGKIIEKLSLDSMRDKHHVIDSDTVFTEEETGAGHTVTFETAYVEEHEETGERCVNFRSYTTSEYFTESQWELATRTYDENNFSCVIHTSEHTYAFPKDEYIEEMGDDNTGDGK